MARGPLRARPRSPLTLRADGLADFSPLAEKDAADDDQQKTETAGYGAERQHHVSSDRARSTARR
jgi:hypothetical protein